MVSEATGLMSAGLEVREVVVEATVLLQEATMEIIDTTVVIIESTETVGMKGESVGTLASKTETAAIRVRNAIITEATGIAPGKAIDFDQAYCLDLQDATMIDHLVIAIQEIGLNVSVETTEIIGGAAEAPTQYHVLEVPTTGEAVEKMGAQLNCNKGCASTAIRKVTLELSVLYFKETPEKEVWIEGEIIGTTVLEEVAEVETVEATLLDNTPEVDHLTLHTKPEVETEIVGIQPGETKATTTDKKRVGEGITVLNQGLTHPEEDAISIRAMTENECDA